jgi:hypothetical protein
VVFAAILIPSWIVISAVIREPEPSYATIAAPEEYGCRDAAVLRRILELIGSDNAPGRKNLVGANCEHFPVGPSRLISGPSRGPVGGYAYFARQKYWFHRLAFYSAP